MRSQLKFISMENWDWIWFLFCRILHSGSLQGWKPASSYKFQKRNGSKKWILKWIFYWRKTIFLMLSFTFSILEDYSVILPSFSHSIYDGSYGRAVLLKLPVLDSWLVTAGHNCSCAMDWGNLKTLIWPNGTYLNFEVLTFHLMNDVGSSITWIMSVPQQSPLCASDGDVENYSLLPIISFQMLSNRCSMADFPFSIKKKKKKKKTTSKDVWPFVPF